MGIDKELIERFKPYLGLKKEKAVEALDLCPLNITDSEA